VCALKKRKIYIESLIRVAALLGIFSQEIRILKNLEEVMITLYIRNSQRHIKSILREIGPRLKTCSLSVLRSILKMDPHSLLKTILRNLMGARLLIGEDSEN